MPDLIMHINYFEQGYDLATAFDKAAEYGFEGIELRGNSQTLKREEYLELVSEQWKRSALKTVVFAIPCDLMMSDAAQRRSNVANAIDLLSKSAALGVKVYNAMSGSLLAPNTPYMEFDKNGSAAASDDQWRGATEGFQKIGDVATDLRVKLGFETHNCYLHDLARPTARLLSMIDSPAVGANLDMSNIVLNKNGESLEECVEILKGRIHYVHLKNLFKPAGVGFCVCAMEDGVINNRLLLRLLRDTGYDGPLCLESPRQGDRDHFAKQDIAYVRGLLNDLEWV